MAQPLDQRIFRLYSLQFLIAIACIVVSILPMTYTGLSVYSKYSQQLVNNTDIFTNQIMDQLRINVEEYIENGIKLNNDVKAITDENENIVDAKLRDRLNAYYSSRNDIVSIAIVDDQGDIILTVPQLNVKEDYKAIEQDWYKDVAEGKVLHYKSDPHVQNIFEGKHDWVFSVYRQIDLLVEGRMTKGVLMLDMSLYELDELCNNLNLGGSGYVYITNPEGEIIYHPQQPLVFSGYKEEKTNGIIKDQAGDKETLTIRKTVDFVDWQLIGVTYIKDIYEGNSRIAQEVLTAVPLILVIIIMLSWYISGRITFPIKDLENKMHRVQEGDLETKFELDHGEKEVVELGKSFNTMVDKLKDLIEENKQEHEAKRVSELNALQAQINPHFLYNTLDSIMWMAESGQNDEVVEMVTALARLFRISISKGRNLITIREEIEHAKNYLFIQKIRYKDKFTFDVNVPDDLLDYLTPKLILQPIIENSIYHGIEYMVDEGAIEILAYVENNEMILEVKDNGLGMSQEVIDKLLFDKDEVIETHKGSGVGVRNVDERIKIRYGDKFGISITSEIEEGTSVKIHLPYIGGTINE